MVRDHWAVENGLHWVMDMVFRDDECRLRTDHAPANFTIIKQFALNLMRPGPDKDSLRLKRKVAAWDDEYLASLIGRRAFARFPWTAYGTLLTQKRARCNLTGQPPAFRLGGRVVPSWGPIAWIRKIIA